MTEGGESGPPAPRPDRGEVLPRRTDIGKNMIEGSRVYFNLNQRVVITTRDKLKLSLIENVPRYTDLGVLLGKLGIFLALVLAVLTTTTKDTFGVSADTWSVLLVLFCLTAGIWTGREVYRYARRKTVDQIVDSVVDDAEENV